MSDVRLRKIKEAAAFVCLGVLISLGIHVAKQVMPFIGNVEFSYLDSVMAAKAEIAPPERSPPFVFFDIDESTHAAWGEPAFTPRHKLARLIRFAVEGGARQVIVDIDLSRDSDADPQLAASLAAAVGSGTHVILLRTYRAEEARGGACVGAHVRPTVYDGLDPKRQNLHWASPLFTRDADGIIRRWRLWEPVCDDTVQGVEALPSVQVVAAALHGGGADGLIALQRRLQTLTAGTAGDREEAKRVDLGEHTLDVSDVAFSERIIYGIPWYPWPGMGRPLVEDGQGGEAPVLSTVPARIVTEASRPIDSGIVRGRVALIGASHADARDIQATPLGLMPGTLVLANAVQSAIAFGQINPPSLGLRLLLQVGLLLAMSSAFVFLPSLAANILLAMLVALVLPVASVFLLRSGVWLDASLPLLLTRTFYAVEFVRFCIRYLPPHPKPAEQLC